MENLIEEISIEKRLAMLNRKYDISDKLDNTVLGVFIGIISGVNIDVFMNVENDFFKWLLVSCCTISIILLIMAIFINSSFVTKCLDLADGSTSYKESKEIKKNVADSSLLRKHFWFCLFFSLIFFCTGIGIYKFKSAASPGTTQVICPYHTIVTDSIKCLNQEIKQQNVILDSLYIEIKKRDSIILKRNGE